jgi:hypothetical protein
MSRENQANERRENQPSEERSLHAGDDREFEDVWWRIEIGIWIFLVLLIGTAATGLLGRGPLAKKKVSSPDGRLVVNYDRVSRFKTPSATIVQIFPANANADEVRLWVNDTMVKHLGLSNVVPQPDEAEPGPDGVTYTWKVGKGTNSLEVRFDLQPDQPGVFEEEFRTDTSQVKVRSVTLP